MQIRTCCGRPAKGRSSGKPGKGKECPGKARPEENRRKRGENVKGGLDGGTEGVRPPAGHVKFIKLRGKPKTEKRNRGERAAAGSCPPYEVRLVNVYFRPPFFAAITAQM